MYAVQAPGHTQGMRLIDRLNPGRLSLSFEDRKDGGDKSKLGGEIVSQRTTTNRANFKQLIDRWG